MNLTPKQCTKLNGYIAPEMMGRCYHDTNNSGVGIYFERGKRSIVCTCCGEIEGTQPLNPDYTSRTGGDIWDLLAEVTKSWPESDHRVVMFRDDTPETVAEGLASHHWHIIKGNKEDAPWLR
jgi:hypothetical protein